MKGTEKQIAWATQLKSDVSITLESIVNGMKNSPSFDPNNAQHASQISVFESRKNKIDACEDSAAIIDFFKGFSRTGDDKKDVPALMAKYKVGAENLGYSFK